MAGVSHRLGAVEYRGVKDVGDVFNSGWVRDRGGQRQAELLGQRRVVLDEWRSEQETLGMG